MNNFLVAVGIAVYGLFSLYEIFSGPENVWWVFQDPEVRILYTFFVAFLLRFAAIEGLYTRQAAWNCFSSIFFCLVASTALCLLVGSGAGFIASGAAAILLGLVLLAQGKAATSERMSEYIKGIRAFLTIFVSVGAIVVGINIFLMLIPSAVSAEASTTILDLEKRLVHIRMLLSFLKPSTWQTLACLFAIAMLGAGLELKVRQKYVHWFLKYSKWTGKSYLFLSLLASFTFFGNGIYGGLAHVEAQWVKDVDAIERGYEEAEQQARQVFAQALVEELIISTQTEDWVPQINDVWKLQKVNRKQNAEPIHSVSLPHDPAIHKPLREAMGAEWSDLSQEKLSVIHRRLTTPVKGNTADEKEDVKKFAEGFVDIVFSNTAEPILGRVLDGSGMGIPAEFVKLLLEPLLSNPIKDELSRLFTEFLKTTLVGEHDLGAVVNSLKEKLHTTVGPWVNHSKEVSLRKTVLYTRLLLTKFEVLRQQDAALKEPAHASIQTFSPPFIQPFSQIIEKNRKGQEARKRLPDAINNNHGIPSVSQIIENDMKQQAERKRLQDAYKNYRAHPPTPKTPRLIRR